MKSNLVEFFKTNNYSSIKDTGMTWDEVGSKFNISGEAARSQWRNYKPDGLLLKSRWQVQTKEGIEWLESYKAGSEYLDTKVIKSIIDEAFALPVKYISKNATTAWDIQRICGLKKETQIINLTDVHLGMDIGGDLFGLQWNKDEYYKRLNVLIQEINPTANIVLNQLGDFTDGINGETTRGGHKLPQNMNSKETIQLGVESILYILDQIDNPVTINWLTNSNHPGVVDYAIGYTLKQICLYRYNYVTFNLIEDFFHLSMVNDIPFLLVHGKDDKHMNRGFGRFFSDKEQNLIKNLMLSKGLSYAYILRSDLHMFSDIEYENFRDIMTPSFANPSAWVQFNFGSNNKGGFTTINVTDEVIVKLIKF